MALPCVNCNQPVQQQDAKFFHGVFVCGTCHTMAESLYSRASQELKNLLLMLQESIRIALIEHRLQFREGVDAELSKKEVLEAIVRLQEMKENGHTHAMASGGSAVSGTEPEPRTSGDGDR